jgi:hypothetical protein
MMREIDRERCEREEKTDVRQNSEEKEEEINERSERPIWKMLTTNACNRSVGSNQLIELTVGLFAELTSLQRL